MHSSFSISKKKYESFAFSLKEPNLTFYLCASMFVHNSICVSVWECMLVYKPILINLTVCVLGFWDEH